MLILFFSFNNDLFILKNEIEIFNSDLKLLRDSNWLSSEENRQKKRHASIVFAVDNAEQAQKAIKKKLYIAELQLVAESYKSAETKTLSKMSKVRTFNKTLHKSRMLSNLCRKTLY